MDGFMDADYEDNGGTRISLSGFVFMLFGMFVNWKENQQLIVYLSINREEYISLVKGIKKAI